MLRLNKYKEVRDGLPDEKQICFDGLKKVFKFNNYISSGYFGDVHNVSWKNNHFVVKLMYDSLPSRNEVRLMTNVSELRNYTPHVPLLYKTYKCPDMKFRGHGNGGIAKSYIDWTFVKHGPGIAMVMENAGPLLGSFFNMNLGFEKEMQCMFQLLYTIHVLQSNNIKHNDIYPNNITFMISPTTYKWLYNVNGICYYVKSKYVPILIDFGQGNSKKTSAYTNDYVHDILKLLDVFKHMSNNKVVIRATKSILKDIRTTDGRLQPQYEVASNVIKTYFGMFTKKTEAGVTHIWSMN